MSFWNELRRRKVPRTLLGYLAAAFVAAQVVDLLVGALHLPKQLLTTLVIIEIALIPFVVAVAWFYDWSSQGITETDTPASSVNWKRVVPAAVVTLVLLIGGLAIAFRKPAEKLDDNLVAVLPFRVSGSNDIAYLREGMMDLLAAKLTGEGGPRAADARSVMSALNNVGDANRDVSREQALEVARSLGAGQVLLGSAVGTPSQLTLTATLTDVRTGKELRADLTGSTDTLPGLIDQFAARLLSIRAGEEQHLTTLTSTSLPALKAYLAAQADYRAARFEDAQRNYRRALDLDSTFALAAIGHILSTGWGASADTTENRSRRLLVKYQDRLGGLDAAMALALGGRSYPDRRPIKEVIDAWERVVTMAPDRSEAWFLYGDVLAHQGGVAGVTDNVEVSQQAFSRSLQLDSTHIPAIVHLVDWAVIDRDTAKLARLEAIKRARNATGLAYQNLTIARLLGDSATARAVRAGMDTMSDHNLEALALRPLVFADGSVEALKALEMLLKRPVTGDDKRNVHALAQSLYLSLGHPRKSTEILQRQIETEPDRRANLQARALLDALYSYGDSAFAARVAGDIERDRERYNASEQLAVGCAFTQWQLWQGKPVDAGDIVRRLRALPAESENHASAMVCAHVINALDATLNQRADAASALSALDDYLKVGPPADETLLNAANIVAARLFERRGDTTGAYRAISRQGFHPAFMHYYPDMVREQARLAEITGDRDKAIKLNTRYLSFHESAEPEMRARDNQVRDRLARLISDGK